MHKQSVEYMYTVQSTCKAMVERLLELRYKCLCCPLQVEEHNGHIFKATQYSIPTYCEYCSSLIWMMDRACVCKRKEQCVHIPTYTHTQTHKHNAMINTHTQAHTTQVYRHTHTLTQQNQTHTQTQTATWINQYCLHIHSTNRMPSNSVYTCKVTKTNVSSFLLF